MAVNEPQTVWRPTDGLSEYNYGGVNNIVDSLGNFLTDPSGVFITDTGVTAIMTPATIWTEDDSL